MAPLILLSGCEMTVDVEGMLGQAQALTGSLTHYNDGGTIELFGGPKIHCLGNFTYRRIGNGQYGDGMMMCDDRRTGPFSFSLSGMRHGHGVGSLNGEAYRFRF